MSKSLFKLLVADGLARRAKERIRLYQAQPAARRDPREPELIRRLLAAAKEWYLESEAEKLKTRLEKLTDQAA